MEKYNNCPNCGGTLDDTGRCQYCGSKVYDFCNIEIGGKSTFLRLKCNDMILTAQVRANPSFSIKQETDCYPVIDMEFVVVGNAKYENISKEQTLSDEEYELFAKYVARRVIR